MKPLITLMTFVFVCINCFAQVDDTEFLAKLKAKAEEEQKLLYQNNTSKIFLVISNADAYKKLSEQISSKVTNAKEFNNIAKLINPSDKTLTGESYNDFLKRVATKHFIDPADEEQNKKRMTAVIGNLTSSKVLPEGSIVGNIVRGFVSSTPILNAATNILNGISTFFKTKMKKGYVESVDETIKQEKLKAFNDEIADYVAFYDNALQINLDFDIKLNSILVRASTANDSVKYFVQAYATKLKIKLNEPITNVSQIQNIFPYDFRKHYFGEADPLYYELVKDNARILKLIAKSNILEAETEVLIKSYFNEFNVLFTKFQNKIRNGGNTVNLNSTLRNEVLSYTESKGLSNNLKFNSNNIVELDSDKSMSFNLKNVSFIDTPFPFSVDDSMPQQSNVTISEKKDSNLNISLLLTVLCIVLTGLNMFLLLKKRS